MLRNYGTTKTLYRKAANFQLQNYTAIAFLTRNNPPIPSPLPRQSAVQTAVDVCCGLFYSDPLTRGMLQNSGGIVASTAVLGSTSGGGGIVGGGGGGGIGVDGAGGGLTRKGTWGGTGAWGGAASPLPQLLSELVKAIGRDDMAVTIGFRTFLFRQVCSLVRCGAVLLYLYCCP